MEKRIGGKFQSNEFQPVCTSMAIPRLATYIKPVANLWLIIGRVLHYLR